MPTGQGAGVVITLSRPVHREFRRLQGKAAVATVVLLAVVVNDLLASREVHKSLRHDADAIHEQKREGRP